MKKLVTILLTLAMLCTLAAPAWAANPTDTAATDLISTQDNGVQTIQQALKDKGGVPGQVNVMFNGECISFPDVIPQILNGCTMIPVRTVMEAMNAKVDYADNAVTVTMNDTTVTFPIGGKTITVTRGGETKNVEMDTAAYVDQAKGESRTMVPLRFLSEACGYTVFWDNAYRTAVVLDTDALAEKIDSQFSAFNNFLATQLKNRTGEKQEGDATLTGALVMENANTGSSATYNITGSMKVYTDGTSVLMKGTYQLDGLYQLLLQQTDLLQTLPAALKTVLEGGLKSLDFTLLVDKDGGYYVNIPLLNSFLGCEDCDGTWIRVAKLGDLLSAASGSDMTMGKLLVKSAESAGDTGSFSLYDGVETSAGLMAAMFGDSAAKTTGDTTTWTLDQDTVLKALGLDASSVGLNSLTGTITMNKAGSSTVKGDLSMTLPTTDTDTTQRTLTASLDAAATAAEGQMTIKAAVSGLFSAEINAKSTTKTVTTLPDMTLPAGAQVVELSDLF